AQRHAFLAADSSGVAERGHDRARPHSRQMAGRAHAGAARPDARGHLAAIRQPRPHLAAGHRRGRGRNPDRGSHRRRAVTVRRELICGPNFSGRSAALMALLRDETFASESFYVGPYSEAALSGLSSTIADEIDIYRAPPSGRAAFGPFDFTARDRQQPQTLSGGEQVLLALHCFSLSTYRAIAIDTALEQPDPANRDAALGYLDPRNRGAESVALIDNRLSVEFPDALPGWSRTDRAADTTAFACDPRRLVADLAPRHAPTIAVRGLHFAYRGGPTIF